MKRFVSCALVLTFGLAVWMIVERPDPARSSGPAELIGNTLLPDEQVLFAGREAELAVLEGPALGPATGAARVAEGLPPTPTGAAEVWSIRGRAFTVGDGRPVEGLGIQLALHEGYVIGAAP